MQEPDALLRCTQRNSQLSQENTRLRGKTATKDLTITVLAVCLAITAAIATVSGINSNAPQRHIGKLELLIEESREDYSLCMTELMK